MSCPKGVSCPESDRQKLARHLTAESLRNTASMIACLALGQDEAAAKYQAAAEIGAQLAITVAESK